MTPDPTTHIVRDGRHDIWRRITAAEAQRFREAGFREVYELAAMTKETHERVAQEINDVQ